MDGINYKELKPGPPLSDFVESYWMLQNCTGEEKQLVIVPDGRIDLSFSFEQPYELTLMGLESHPSAGLLPPNAIMFAISFKLLAIEYLFGRKFPDLTDSFYQLPADYLGISTADFESFEQFTSLMGTRLQAMINKDVEERKQHLFELIYTTKGDICIKELSEKVYWSSRQINRYFNDWFGISLKAYCNILRFRASFQHIKDGKLYPQQNFTDQAHFIKNVKKFAGVTPKELSKNKNDRFIQFSVLPGK